MQPKTQTTLNQLRIGDSYVYPKRQDPWRVMARADKNGRVAVNQISVSDRKPIFKHDELKKGSTTVIFLRHTVPVPGEAILIESLAVGDIFHTPDDIIHEWEVTRTKHPGSWMVGIRRLDQAAGSYTNGLSTVVFIKHKDA